MKKDKRYLALALAVIICILTPMDTLANSITQKENYIYESEYFEIIDGEKYRLNAKITDDYVVYTEYYKEIDGKFVFDDKITFYVTDDGTSYKHSEKKQDTKIQTNVFSKTKIIHPSSFELLSTSDWVGIGEEYQHRVLIEGQTVEELAITIMSMAVGVVKLADALSTARDLLSDILDGWKYVGELTERDVNYSHGYKKFRIGTRAYRYSDYSYPLGDWHWRIYLR